MVGRDSPVLAPSGSTKHPNGDIPVVRLASPCTAKPAYFTFPLKNRGRRRRAGVKSWRKKTRLLAVPEGPDNIDAAHVSACTAEAPSKNS